MSIESRLSELGLSLPDAPPPAANYVPYVRSGSMLHTAGQIPLDTEGKLIRGRLGDGFSTEQGYEAARRCALAILAQVKAAAGSLDAVAQIVKLNVFVASHPDFGDQPEVANGASDLMAEIFGEAGRHARSAVGVAVLPRGVAVEIDAVIALKDG